MERYGKAGIVYSRMTIRTSRRRTRKLRQVRRGLQIRHRSRMTQCTGIIMNRYYNFATMTRCTFAARSDRGVAKAAAVGCMVVVTMDIRTDLLGMTGGASY